MYALIILIHVVFVGVAYLLSLWVLEGVFLISWLFFLFYFSPLFFLDNEAKKKQVWDQNSLKDILSQFSLKKSLFVPISLFYVALYLLFFSVFWNKEQVLFFHGVIVFGIYTLFIGYALGFYWKRDIFFESLRFHTIFTLSSTILLATSVGFSGFAYEWLHLLILFSGILSATFLLMYTPHENSLFLSLYLFAFFTSILVWAFLIFPDITLIFILSLFVIFSIFLFEYFPKTRIFAPYTTIIQYFSLFVLLLCLPTTLYLTTIGITSTGILLLSLSILFLFSVHVRYTNYVSYMIAVFLMFFVYATLFSWLLDPTTPISLFLFIFFLPTLLIGTTYLWEEAHMYDFIILHYSSALFSFIYSVYIIFFIWWWGETLFITSLCIFGMAFLLFMSYFRFRSDTSTIH